MDAEAMQYLSSGHGVDPSLGLYRDVLSLKVLKKGTANPLRCAKTQVNGF